MSIFEHGLYREDISYVCGLDLPWDKFQDRSIMVTGATGMIGSFLIDCLMEKNKEGLNCTVYAMGRDRGKFEKRLGRYSKDTHCVFIEHDINLEIDEEIETDYIIHLASNTHPVAYATDPVGTITTNIIGLRNLLEYAGKHKIIRLGFASSNEIYGENRGDVELFDEEYCGYINCNTLRAGYQESKRCGESLCQAYIRQRGVDSVIMRLTRSYGPTLLNTDSKALSQFLKNAVEGEDIVLKSKGTQYFSYTYMADAAAGILYVMLKGETGEAYNISNEASDIMLKDLAGIIAGFSKTKVVFDLPDEVEAQGFSTVTKARLSNEKIKKIGFVPEYDIVSGIERTLMMMKEK